VRLRSREGTGAPLFVTKSDDTLDLYYRKYSSRGIRRLRVSTSWLTLFPAPASQSGLRGDEKYPNKLASGVRNYFARSA